MKYLEIVYPYWDTMFWYIGRFFFWAFLVIAGLLFLCWFIEQILQPIGECIKSAWWDWTKRCPRCESTRLEE
jgi:hypothetical protein